MEISVGDWFLTSSCISSLVNKIGDFPAQNLARLGESFSGLDPVLASRRSYPDADHGHRNVKCSYAVGRHERG